MQILVGQKTRKRPLTFILPICFLGSCISYEPSLLIPEITLSAEDISFYEENYTNLSVDFGIDVAINESDSLLNVEQLPGVRVRSIVANGAADSAGIQIGDIILAIDNLETNTPDTILAIQQTDHTGSYEFRVRRNTAVFSVTIDGRQITTTDSAKELYRIDPIATRASYETELGQINDQAKIATARVIEIFADSPLLSAGLKVNDRVLAINGHDLNSAQDLVSRVNTDFELGEELTLTIYDGRAVTNRRVKLWEPGRSISRINFGPILQYDSSINLSSKSISVFDFWLFAVYRYSQTGNERSHNILELFSITSDYGELVEVQE